MISNFTHYIVEKYTGIPNGAKATVKTPDAAARLNLRSKPSKEASNILDKIPSGKQVTVLGKNGIFYQVNYSGKTGYVEAKYVIATTTTTTAVASDSLKRDIVTTKVAGTQECATYVRNTFKKIFGDYVDGVVGNAWGFFQNLTGKVVFNVFDQIAKTKKAEIEKVAATIAKTKKNVVVTADTIGVKYPNHIAMNKQIVSLYPSSVTIDMQNVKKYDIVGLFYRISGNHVRAFDEAAFRPSGIFRGTSVDVDDDSAELEKPFTFNTHVGYVVDVINGVPVVEHNIHGKVHTTPMTLMTTVNNPTHLMVTWIKRADV